MKRDPKSHKCLYRDPFFRFLFVEIFWSWGNSMSLILLGKLLNMHLRYLRQCTDVCVYLFLGTNVGQLTDKSMLTAPTHACTQCSRSLGKSQLEEIRHSGEILHSTRGGAILHSGSIEPTLAE